jgi:hypothetical protein
MRLRDERTSNCKRAKVRVMELGEMTVWQASGGSEKVLMAAFWKRSLNHICFTS